MKKQRQPRRSFTREFKIESVRQVVEGGRSIAAVAREIGIHANLLSVWKREVLADQVEAFPGRGRLKPSDEEFRRLERENRSLRQEIAFLKKTAAYFAKDLSRGSV